MTWTILNVKNKFYLIISALIPCKWRIKRLFEIFHNIGQKFTRSRKKYLRSSGWYAPSRPNEEWSYCILGQTRVLRGGAIKKFRATSSRNEGGGVRTFPSSYNVLSIQKWGIADRSSFFFLFYGLQRVSETVVQKCFRQGWDILLGWLNCWKGRENS